MKITHTLAALAATTLASNAAMTSHSHTTNFNQAYGWNNLAGSNAWNTNEATDTSVNFGSTDAAIIFTFTPGAGTNGSSNGPALNSTGDLIDGANSNATGSSIFLNNGWDLVVTATGTADTSLAPAGATGITVINEMITISFDNLSFAGSSADATYEGFITDADDASNTTTGSLGLFTNNTERRQAANYETVGFDPTDAAVAGNTDTRTFNFGQNSGGAFSLGDALKAGGTITYTYDLDFTPVPEPSSTALLGLGGLALILRRRK